MKWIIKLCLCNVDFLHPRLYKVKQGCREVDFFLIFALKHRLYILVRTARQTCTHKYVLSKKKTCLCNTLRFVLDCKNDNFRMKNSDIFRIFAQNIDFGTR